MKPQNLSRFSFCTAIVLLIILLVTPLLTGCQNSEGSETSEPLKMGALSMMTMLPLFVAQQEGLFEKQGVKVEIVPFASVVERDTALRAGKLDCIVDDVFGGILLNQEQPIIQVTAVSSVQSPMFFVIASGQSNIRKASDLKNVEIGISLKTIIEYSVETMLVANGLKKDEIKYASVPSMPLRLEMMSQNKINAAAFSRPLADAAVLAGNVVICNDAQKSLLTSSIMFTAETVKNRPNDIKKFLKAWDQATKNISNDPPKYQSLLIETAKISEAVAKTISVPKFDSLRALKQEDLQPKTDWLLGKEIIKREVKLADIATARFLP
ncbi:MAG TPA: MetQ/NlpA family ABC transporter substrate-binding protein [Dehalococcoidales bacterium]|nr:MetQ/NlpA family ABC transporter substrate-binding protein [Dehalococcoidales bacterium]